jgi:hypothetical protein
LAAGAVILRSFGENCGKELEQALEKKLGDLEKRCEHNGNIGSELSKIDFLQKSVIALAASSID